MQDVSMVRGSTQVFEIFVTDASGDAYMLKDGEKLIFGVKKNYYGKMTLQGKKCRVIRL